MAEQVEAVKSTVQTIFEPLEGLLGGLGLNTPLKRFLFGGLAGLSAEYYFKPGYAFTNGVMRTPIYLDNKPGNTYTPFGMIPALIGLSFAVFV